jgi:HAD superfamily hydrolase (TIGR01484 family)
MEALATAVGSHFSEIAFVLTDMDETLTYRGALSARTYDALERLHNAGVKVIPVTAAPAGWCDQMARMWPIDGVIAENGSLFIRRLSDGHGVTRTFWHPNSEQLEVKRRLAALEEHVIRLIPSAKLADDQPFRLASLAFTRPKDAGECASIETALREAGANTTLNNLWVLGWFGNYDKLAMSRKVLREFYGLDVGTPARDAVLYCGDSENDAPMFGFFNHTVGVSTVRQHLARISVLPKWITYGPGGDGFVEVADAILADRR